MVNERECEPTSKVLVLFDYGGVVADNHTEPAEGTLANLLGVGRVHARELLSEKSEQGAAFREGRITESDFWDRVFDLAGQPLGSRPISSVLSTLWAQTYTINRDVFEVLKMLRARVSVGILTNIDCSRSAYLENVVGILNYVDVYFPSYQFQAIKPAPQLWKAVDAAARAHFGHDIRIIYFDDREIHVQASRNIGWDSIVFNGVMELRNELAFRRLISA